MKTEITISDYYLRRKEIDKELQNTGQNKVSSEKAIANAINSKSPLDHTHSLANNTNTNGFMSYSDKNKLDNIEDEANNYSHPESHSTSFITNDQQYSNISSNSLANQKAINDAINTKFGNHNHDNRYFTETEITTNYYDKTTSDGRFAPKSHDHDDRYFTETEITNNYYNKTTSDGRFLKTGTGTVTSNNILDGTIVNNDIADGTIEFEKINLRTSIDRAIGGSNNDEKLITSKAVHDGLALKSDSTHKHDSDYLKTGTGTVTSENILNGTITNDDISSTAQISASKINGLAQVATSGSYNDLSNKPNLIDKKNFEVIKLGESTTSGNGTWAAGEIVIGVKHDDAQKRYYQIGGGFLLDTGYPILAIVDFVTVEENEDYKPYENSYIKKDAIYCNIYQDNIPEKVYLEGTSLHRNEFTVSNSVIKTEGGFTQGNFYICIGSKDDFSTNILHFDASNNNIYVATSSVNLVPVTNYWYQAQAISQSGGLAVGKLMVNPSIRLAHFNMTTTYQTGWAASETPKTYNNIIEESFRPKNTIILATNWNRYIESCHITNEGTYKITFGATHTDNPPYNLSCNGSWYY